VAKAFLYTGIVMLIMIGVLVSANYVFLTGHQSSESELKVLEMDSVGFIEADVKNMLARDGNNTLADAMSDAAFVALGTGTDSIPTICNRLDPKNPASQVAPYGANISKWIADYSGRMFANVTNITLAKFTSFRNTPSSYTQAVAPTCRISYQANISYFVIKESPFYMALNQSVIHNKTLEVTNTLFDPVGGTFYYTITVKDQIMLGGSYRTDFSKTVGCSLGKCTAS